MLKEFLKELQFWLMLVVMVLLTFKLYKIEKTLKRLIEKNEESETPRGET